MANTALPYPDMASASPFGLSDEPISLSPSIANAIGTHLTEIAAIRDTSDSVGNVLAIVTFPADAGTSRACDRRPWSDTRIRMSYEKLTSLGSKKIQQMFSDRAQARFRRRHGFETQLPDGIDYVLDFTPPSEGPELADLIGALWLPRAVKVWFLAGQYIPGAPLEHTPGVPLRPLADKAVGAILVLGHDDVCKNMGCSTYLRCIRIPPCHHSNSLADPCSRSHRLPRVGDQARTARHRRGEPIPGQPHSPVAQGRGLLPDPPPRRYHPCAQSHQRQGSSPELGRAHVDRRPGGHLAGGAAGSREFPGLPCSRQGADTTRSTPSPNGSLRHPTQSSSRSARKRPSSWPTPSRSRAS